MPFAFPSCFLRTAFNLAGAFALAGCANHPGPTARDSDATKSTPAAQVGPKSFPSPEAAAAALKDALLTQDRPLLISIFGADGKQLVLTGDAVEESHDMEAFGRHMTEYLRVDRPTADKAVLHIGQENWPFPIPVVKAGNQWCFDTAAGKDELLNRRIGHNELHAIAVCRAYVGAQKEYARADRTGEHVVQYARHFRSTEGKKDGLYWPAVAGEPLSPFGPLVAEAREEGYGPLPKDGQPHPYHGYVFRILTEQGDAAPGGTKSYLEDGRLTQGFALLAGPSAWGSSGIMTFIVNQDGKVYEKNLGPETSESDQRITAYDPDKTWTEVKD